MIFRCLILFAIRMTTGQGLFNIPNQNPSVFQTTFSDNNVNQEQLRHQTIPFPVKGAILANLDLPNGNNFEGNDFQINEDTSMYVPPKLDKPERFLTFVGESTKNSSEIEDKTKVTTSSPSTSTRPPFMFSPPTDNQGVDNNFLNVNNSNKQNDFGPNLVITSFPVIDFGLPIESSTSSGLTDLSSSSTSSFPTSTNSPFNSAGPTSSSSTFDTSTFASGISTNNGNSINIGSSTSVGGSSNSFSFTNSESVNNNIGSFQGRHFIQDSTIFPDFSSTDLELPSISLDPSSLIFNASLSGPFTDRSHSSQDSSKFIPQFSTNTSFSFGIPLDTTSQPFTPVGNFANNDSPTEIVSSHTSSAQDSQSSVSHASFPQDSSPKIYALPHIQYPLAKFNKEPSGAFASGILKYLPKNPHVVQDFNFGFGVPLGTNSNPFSINRNLNKNSFDLNAFFIGKTQVINPTEMFSVNNVKTDIPSPSFIVPEKINFNSKSTSPVSLTTHFNAEQTFGDNKVPSLNVLSNQAPPVHAFEITSRDTPFSSENYPSQLKQFTNTFNPGEISDGKPTSYDVPVTPWVYHIKSTSYGDPIIYEN